MMGVFQKIKRGCLGLSAVTMMAGAELLGIWQLIRNILLLLLRVLDVVIGGAFFFFGSVLFMASLSTENGGFFKIVIGTVGFVLLAVLLYRIACAIYSFVARALETVLNAVSCGRILTSLVIKAERTMERYLNAFPQDAPERAGFWIFGVPYVIYWGNWIAGKICDAVQFLIYPLSVGAGLYGFWWMCDFERDFSSLQTADYLVLFVMVALVVGIAARLGHELVQAITEARESLWILGKFFATYGSYFKRKRTSADNGRRQEQGQYKHTYEDAGEKAVTEPKPRSNNPYIQILEKAATAEELQKLYRSNMKKLHPDVCEDYPQEESNRRAAQLNAAYEFCKERFGEYA